MEFLFRADASIGEGTGHVMRCLTLAGELMARGHGAHLLTGGVGIDWLRTTIEESGVTVHACTDGALPLDRVRDLDPDWLIVDSYRIPADLVTRAARHVPVLAIVDGDDRGIEGALLLDQNLGAEAAMRAGETPILAGAQYALVRRAVTDAVRSEPWVIRGPLPHVLCFMGGTDATGTVVAVAAAVAAVATPLSLTVVAPVELHAEIQTAALGAAELRLIAPTPDLPRLLAAADLVVSAAGTSAWDICTLGVPAVFIAVVDNQRAGLNAIVSRGLALGIDAVDSRSTRLARVTDDLALLIQDDQLRETLSRRSMSEFDGRGAARVADRLEREGVGPLLEW